MKTPFNIDLHMHSDFSNDGEFNVNSLVEMCSNKHISVFSLTDHNSAKGNTEAAGLASHRKINFISGIEIDCIYDNINLHVLGYNIDWKSSDFKNLEDSVSHKVLCSLDEMIHNIKKIGFNINKDAVLAKAEGKLPTAELIAEVMLSDEEYFSPLLLPYIKGGERSDMPYINFYLDYFAQGKPAFVPIDFIDYEEAISLIRNNGGTPIVAHPGLNLKGKESIVEVLLDNGAEGLEVFNNYHTTSQIDYLASVVQRRNLIMTCGSDFHGKTKPLIEIGQYEFRDKYKEYLLYSVDRMML